MAKEKKEKAVTAASIVLGLLGLKRCPCDADIIRAVQAGVEVTKFDKTHLAWYKHQYRGGRWHDGVRQVINQPEKPEAEKAAKPAKAGKKVLLKKKA